jgi:hypothetical protein
MLVCHRFVGHGLLLPTWRITRPLQQLQDYCSRRSNQRHRMHPLRSFSSASASISSRVPVVLQSDRRCPHGNWHAALVQVTLIHRLTVTVLRTRCSDLRKPHVSLDRQALSFSGGHEHMIRCTLAPSSRSKQSMAWVCDSN